MTILRRGTALGSASTISKAKTPLKALVDSVGSDMVKERQSYPLNFRSLEEHGT
jgi:hypothetical protein